MKRFTVNDIMALKPCYDYDDVTALIGQGKTLLQIQDLDIPIEDRVWVVIRLIPTSDVIIFANLCADRAVRNHALHYGDPQIEVWAAKWLSGEDRAQKSAAVMRKLAKQMLYVPYVAYVAVCAAHLATWATENVTDAKIVQSAAQTVAAFAKRSGTLHINDLKQIVGGQ